MDSFKLVPFRTVVAAIVAGAAAAVVCLALHRVDRIDRVALAPEATDRPR